MLPGTEIVPHLKDFGFDDNRSWAVYRAGVEDGTFPKSGGKNRREDFSVKDSIRLVVGVACGEPIKRVSSRSGLYCALQDDNGKRLDEVLARRLESVRSFGEALKTGEVGRGAFMSSKLLNSRVEIDQGFPRVKIVTELPDEKADEWLFGPIRDRDSTMTGVRHVAIIPGTVLFRLAFGLHFNSWDPDAPITSNETPHAANAA